MHKVVGGDMTHNFHFFNYIIKLQAVLPGRAQKAQQSLNTSEEVRGFAGGVHENQTVNWQVQRNASLRGVCGFPLVLYGFMLSVSSAPGDEGFFLGDWAARALVCCRAAE